MDDADGLDELARILRDRVGSDFRAEAEEGERLAELAALRGRTLGDVASDLRAGGQRVVASTSGQQVSGVVTRSGGDFLELESVAGAVVVHLTAGVWLRLAEREATSASPVQAGAATLRGRLLELELAHVEVEVAAATGQTWKGRLRAVGRDHVLVVDRDGESIVPLPLIALVFLRGTR